MPRQHHNQIRDIIANALEKNNIKAIVEFRTRIIDVYAVYTEGEEYFIEINRVTRHEPLTKMPPPPYAIKNYAIHGQQEIIDYLKTNGESSLQNILKNYPYCWGHFYRAARALIQAGKLQRHRKGVYGSFYSLTE